MLELKTREDAAKILLDAGWTLESVTDVLRGPVQAIAPLHGQPIGKTPVVVRMGDSSASVADWETAVKNGLNSIGVASGGITASVMPSSSGVPSGLAREIGRMIVGGEFEAHQFVGAALNADICPQCGSASSMHCPQSNCAKLVD